MTNFEPDLGYSRDVFAARERARVHALERVVEAARALVDGYSSYRGTSFVALRRALDELGGTE